MASKRLLPLLTSRSSLPTFSRHTPRPSVRPVPILALRPTPIPLYRLSSSIPSSNPTGKSYTFKDIQRLTTHPHPTTLLIDVREPSELASTGRIPGAVNMPITSNPDAVYLSEDDFYDRFGFRKPSHSPSSPTSSPSGSGKLDSEEEEDFDIEKEVGEAAGPGDAGFTAGHGGADVAAKEGLGGRGVRYAGSVGAVDEGKGEVEEVVFYCKAGVRSRAAAQMAKGEGGWAGVRVGGFDGGWLEWEREGGAKG